VGSIYEYSLSTEFDITSASFTQSKDISSENSTPKSLFFNDVGSKMFTLDNDTDSVYEYSLSTPYDISTASYTGNSFDISGQNDRIGGLVFNNDGTNFFVVGEDPGTVYSYNSIGGGVSSVTLSTNDANLSGKILRVKDTAGSAGSNPVTIDTEGSETIDGSSSISLNIDYGVKQLQSDGTNWHLISDE